jgi:hypothetical protein
MYNSRAAWSSLLLAFFVILVSPKVQAKENSLKKGKWALQFQIEDDFSLRSFQGTNLSLKKQTSDRSAYRLGISVNFNFGDGSNEGIQNDSISAKHDTDQIGHSFQFALQKIIYPNPTADINLFYGFGPAFGYSYSRSESNDSYSSGSSRYSKSSNTGWSAGGSVVMGVEWFASKDFSLTGEYSNSFSYSKSVGESETIYRQSGSVNQSKYKNDSEGFKISNTVVRLGLSVYF